MTILEINAKEPSRNIGLNFFYGKQVSHDSVWHHSEAYDWIYSNIAPAYTWKWNKKELSLEGIISSYDFDKGETTTMLGLCLLGRYNLIEHNNLALYVEGGGGASWWNHTPSHDLIDGYFPALFQCGFGLKISKYRIGYRFHHASLLGREDCGINSKGIIFGIEF